MKSVFNRISILLTTGALIMAQVIIPVHAAYATSAPGNNGTVKINDEDTDADPGVGNEPHLTTCTVNVRWYGFDAGLRDSTVTFESQSPTAGDQLLSPVGPQQADFTAPEPTTGSTLLNEKNYTLAFSGASAAQGYHVKATVYTDGSKGNDTKSKVFWLPSTCGPETTPNPDFTLTGVCGIDNDTVNVSSTDDYTAGAPIWANSKVSVTFTIKPGVNKLFANGSTSITITKDEVNTSQDCSNSPEGISNPSVSLAGKCGLNNDSVIVSESADYTSTSPAWNGSVVSVTFTIKADVNKLFTSTGTKSVTITTNESNTLECPRDSKPCTVNDNLFTKEWTYNGTTMPEAGADSKDDQALPGKFEFVNNSFFTGIHLTTPAVESYVDGLIDAGDTNIQDVDAMSYTTYRSTSSTGYAGTLPAYILQIDKDGNPATSDDLAYLFYEPYNNGTVVAGTWQSWDAINSGNAKWWMSGTGQALQTWDYFKTTLQHATVLGYGFNQGTYNAGADTYIKSMTFDCATTTFSAPGKGGVPEVTPTPTPTPVTVPTPIVPAGKGAVMPTELPETGTGSNALFIGLAAAAVAYGAVYFAQPKRRYE